jgi:1-deoxy-D-xylulose-5-phosphate synthase
MAEARCLKGEDFRIIAVIGDGAISAGMAFEGLNWTGDRRKGMIIILNDNEMSISPNVGALSSYLNRIMTGQTVSRIRAEVKTFLKSVPGIGEQMLKFSRQVEESLKTFFVPGAIFEELGFTYVGPLEGHRLDPLIKNLENVRQLEGPVLVHVLTQKGKGYHFAENDPSRFHGMPPFDIDTGEPVNGGPSPTPPSYTKVFGRTVVTLAEEDPRIVAITAAMSEGTGLDQFAGKFPNRFYDVGMAEQHGVTFAAGLATQGLIPIVAIYSTFMQRAYDQVIHDVCLQNLPVVMALDRGGMVGADGPTHHGLFDFTFLRTVPNIIVMAPKDENELQHLLKTAVTCGGPASLRYPRGTGLGVPLDEKPTAIPIGKGEILMDSPAARIALVAIGSCVYPALAAAERPFRGYQSGHHRALREAPRRGLSAARREIGPSSPSSEMSDGGIWKRRPGLLAEKGITASASGSGYPGRVRPACDIWKLRSFKTGSTPKGIAAASARCCASLTAQYDPDGKHREKG